MVDRRTFICGGLLTTAGFLVAGCQLPEDEGQRYRLRDGDRHRDRERDRERGRERDRERGRNRDRDKD